jgi:hypothetical protein
MPLFAVLALLVVCAAGVVHGVRAASAQWMYERAKYGADRSSLLRILALCESAQRLYPFNYYFCLWAATQACQASDVPGQGAAHAAADRWCARGIALNPYNRKLQIIRARRLQGRAPRQAAAQWARYVDWQFWDPYNHSLLAELYADAGEVEQALAELEWARGSPYFAAARGRLLEAWEREKQSAAAGGAAPAGRPR